MSERDDKSPGKLFVVATPIGNLEDITLRAVRVLREADRVLAEDTRRTRTLLTHLGLGTPLTSLHAHTTEHKVAALVEELRAGKRFALVTDAGTPLVSDPGFALVEGALAAEVEVEAVPGASAVMTALCVSGVRVDTFRFVGFLPRSGKKRKSALESIAKDGSATVLFEAPPRLQGTLADLCEACGPARRAAVCRELTKLHEEVIRGTLRELVERFGAAPRGELTLVVEARGAADEAKDEAANAPSEGAIDARITSELALGRGPKDIAQALAQEHGLARRDVYQRVLELKRGS